MLNTTISLVGGSTVNRERIEAELTGYWLAALPIDPRAVRACVCACVKDLLPDVIGIENIFTAQSEHACIYAHNFLVFIHYKENGMCANQYSSHTLKP